MARRPRINVTVSPEVYVFLKQPGVNASGLITQKIREDMSETKARNCRREAIEEQLVEPESEDWYVQTGDPDHPGPEDGEGDDETTENGGDEE